MNAQGMDKELAHHGIKQEFLFSKKSKGKIAGVHFNESFFIVAEITHMFCETVINLKQNLRKRKMICIKTGRYEAAAAINILMRAPCA